MTRLSEQLSEISPYIGKKILCIKEFETEKDYEDKFKLGEFYLIEKIGFSSGLIVYLINDGSYSLLNYHSIKEHFRLITLVELRKEKIKSILNDN